MQRGRSVEFPQERPGCRVRAHLHRQLRLRKQQEVGEQLVNAMRMALRYGDPDEASPI